MTSNKFLLLFNLLLGALFVIACKTAPKNDDKIFAPIGNPTVDKITVQLQAEPTNDSLWAMRGKALYKEELFDESIRDFKKAISLDSSQWSYFHALADAQMDFNQSKEAMATLDILLRREPKRLQSLLKLSELQLIIKQYAQAETSVNKVMELSKGNAEGHFMMGRIKKEMSDTLAAINEFQSAVEADANHQDAYLQLGILMSQKRNPIALKYLDNALRIDSINTETLYAKAMYYQNLKQPDYNTAMKLYRKIIGIDVHYTDAFFNMGVLLLEQKNPVEAEKNFELSTKADATCAKCYYMRGLMAEMRKDNKAAKSFYEESYRIDPENTGAKQAADKLK